MEKDSSVVRVGIIGDVHCYADVLVAVIDRLQDANLDAILCVGDIVDGPGDADDTCRLLMERNIECVAGNHEQWFLENKARDKPNATQTLSQVSKTFIAGLPTLRFYQTPHGRAMLCHGVGLDDEAFLRPDTRGYALQDIPTLRELMIDPDLKFMLGGHTHQIMVRAFEGLTVVNAGTIHQEFDAQYCVVDFEQLSVEFSSALTENFGMLVQTFDLPVPTIPLS